jgi:hypothetical protein
MLKKIVGPKHELILDPFLFGQMLLRKGEDLKIIRDLIVLESLNKP